jgi:hypothetical protein
VCPKWLLSLWYIRRKACTYLASSLALSPIGLNQASTWASSPRSTIEWVQNDFCAYGMFDANRALILHRHQHCLEMDQNEIPHEPRDLRLPSGVSKTIHEAMVRSAQTVHLSCVKSSTNFERTESSFHLSLVTYEYHHVRPKWFQCLWYIRRKPFTYLASRLALYKLNWVKHPLERCHLGVLSGASKMISEAMICSAQIVHISCVKIGNIFEQSELSFHLSLVT